MADELSLSDDTFLESTQEVSYASQSLDDETVTPTSPLDTFIAPTFSSTHIKRQFFSIKDNEIIGERGIDLRDINLLLSQANTYYKLNLCMCLYSEDDLDELIKIFLLPDCHIHEISLAHNPAINHYFDKILDVLTLMQTRLTSINLNHTRINDTYMSRLINIIIPTFCLETYLYPIEKIVLDYCEISPDSLSKLINELHVFPKTHQGIHLSLNGIPIGQTSVIEALAACLQDPTCPIVKLELANTALTNVDVDRLLTPLQMNASLIALDLSNNPITDAIPALETMLTYNGQITELTLPTSPPSAALTDNMARNSHNQEKKRGTLFSNMYGSLFSPTTMQTAATAENIKKCSDGRKRQRLD